MSTNAQGLGAGGQGLGKRTTSPLGLFTGGDDVRRGTLDELFASVYWPYLEAEKDARPKTRQAYLDMLAHWRTIVGRVPLCEITKETLLGFRLALRQLPGRKAALLSPRTVHKHLRQLRALLAFFGPADGAHPDALAVLDDLPRMRLPSPGRSAAQHVTSLNEFFAMMAATPRMRRPARGLPCRRTDWWAAFLYVLFVTGWRIETVLLLSWGDLVGDVLLAREGIMNKGSSADAKTLPRKALDAVARIRPFSAAAGDRIFAWPCCLRYLYDSMDRLQALAGIPKERRRWMKFHGLRKRHSAEVTLLGGAGAAQMSLGHTSIKTTLDHYVPKDEATAPFIAQLPLPDAPGDDRQLWLFE